MGNLGKLGPERGSKVPPFAPRSPKTIQTLHLLGTRRRPTDYIEHRVKAWALMTVYGLSLGFMG